MNSPRCILSTIESDSHMWNLIYLELLLEEEGWTVANLGCCVPPQELEDAIRTETPDLVVVSTINGSGAIQGLELIRGLRERLGAALPPVVIGGRLTTAVEADADAAAALRVAGYAAVCIGPPAISEFCELLRTLAPQHLPALVS